MMGLIGSFGLGDTQYNLKAKIIYTGQKNLSPTCLFPIDLKQKQSNLFYCNCLLDLNF